MKKIVSVSLGSPTRDHAVVVELMGEQFDIRRRGTNGDLGRAVALYRELDGVVDAFGVGGIEFYIEVGGRRFYWRDARRIRAAVRRSKVGDGNGVRRILARRAVQALERRLGEDGRSLRGMPGLMTTAVDRYFVAETLVDAGCDMVFGDLMFGLGVPIPLRSMATIRMLSRVMMPVLTRLPFHWLYSIGDGQTRPPTGKYANHYARAGIVAGDFLQIREHMPADLRGKIVLTNTTTRQDVEELRARGVHLLVTETPRLEGRSFGSNVVEAVLRTMIDKPHEQVTEADFAALIERIPLLPSVETLNPPA